MVSGQTVQCTRYERGAVNTCLMAQVVAGQTGSPQGSPWTSAELEVQTKKMQVAQTLRSLGVCGDAAGACKKLLVGVKRKTVPSRRCLMTAVMAARVVAKDVGQGVGRGCWPGLWPRMLPRVMAKVVSQGGGQGRLLARVVAKVVGQDCCPGWWPRMLAWVVMPAEVVGQGCWPGWWSGLLARKE